LLLKNFTLEINSKLSHFRNLGGNQAAATLAAMSIASNGRRAKAKSKDILADDTE
jgi:hypothetical protein